jgi:hypothetical protein
MLVPRAVSRAALAAEAPAARAWAARKGWKVSINLRELRMTARMKHPADGGKLIVRADFSDYRLLPPAWVLVDVAGNQRVPSAWPSAGTVLGGSSIFHSVGVLCAQFNRLAYGDYAGPHGSWGGAANWLNVTEGTRADTVADMLAVIRLHLEASPGRMG